MYIKTGDLVEVIAGKCKSQTGRVTRVDRARQRVYIGGVNMVKRHQRASMMNEQGQIIEKEAPIHVSNVRLYSEDDQRGYRIGQRFVGANGDLFANRAEALATFKAAPERLEKVRVFLKKGGEISQVPEPQRG
jgi:large subunit ribosomal protein L24